VTQASDCRRIRFAASTLRIVSMKLVRFAGKSDATRRSDGE
jgi:hypothetical protein